MSGTCSGRGHERAGWHPPLHVLALLRPFFDYAISQELMRDNPAMGIR
jgi:hypothetical protein